MELTKDEKKKLKYTSDVIRLDQKHLDKSIKEYVRVLKSEMNILGERMLDGKTDKRMNLHSTIWTLKHRVDEIEGRIDERKGPNSSDTKVSK